MTVTNYAACSTDADANTDTDTNTDMQGYAVFDYIDIIDDMELFDGVDPLFDFDVFEPSETQHGLPLDNGRRLSLTFARRFSIASVINEDQEYQLESLFPDHYPFHNFSLDHEDCMPSMVPLSRSVTTIAKHNRPARNPKISRPTFLSLLTSVQLEQQVEQTKARLAESMERSAMSRKRLNEEVDSCSLEEYSPRDSYKTQRSNSAPASVLSQSRARFASYMNSGMTISSGTL